MKPNFNKQADDIFCMDRNGVERMIAFMITELESHSRKTAAGIRVIKSDHSSDNIPGDDSYLVAFYFKGTRSAAKFMGDWVSYNRRNKDKENNYPVGLAKAIVYEGDIERLNKVRDGKEKFFQRSIEAKPSHIYHANDERNRRRELFKELK